jgi:hypothetical protein
MHGFWHSTIRRRTRFSRGEYVGIVPVVLSFLVTIQRTTVQSMKRSGIWTSSEGGVGN